MDVIIPHDKEFGPGIQLDDTIVVAASKIFRYQLDMMRTLEHDVLLFRGVEPLHKMRVAVRRVRIAYRVLDVYISKSVIRPNLINLRKIGDALGAVRDFDIFLINAENYKLTMGGSAQNDFEIMMTYFNNDRGLYRKKLLELLEGQWYREFIDEFEQIIASLQNWSLAKGEIGTSSQTLPVAREIIRYRYQKLLEFEPISGDEKIDRLHKLRISVKVCRYSIEFFEEILGEGAKTLIERLITIQDYLGEVNDAAVGCVFIENFLNNNIFISEFNSGIVDKAVEYLTCLKEQVKNKIINFPSTWKVIHEPPFISALTKIRKI